MTILKQFREFAMKGNVVDLAVGIIIGAAFGKIVSSLVNDVMMPPIGALIGGLDFSNLVITLKESVGSGAPVVIKYGAFINTIIDFIIVAFCIFLLIRAMDKFQKKEIAATPEPVTKECPECLMQIPLKAKRCAHCAVAV